MFCSGMMALVKIAASHTASHTASTRCVTHSAVEWSGEGWCSVALVSEQVLHRSFIVPAAPRGAKGRMVRLAILMAPLRDLTADLMARPFTHTHTRRCVRSGPASPPPSRGRPSPAQRRPHPRPPAPPPGRTRRRARAAARGPGTRPRVRSHCRFRNRGTEYVSEYGIKWTRGSLKRQCDRALTHPRAAADRLWHGAIYLM